MPFLTIICKRIYIKGLKVSEINFILQFSVTLIGHVVLFTIGKYVHSDYPTLHDLLAGDWLLSIAQPLANFSMNENGRKTRITGFSTTDE